MIRLVSAHHFLLYKHDFPFGIKVDGVYNPKNNNIPIEKILFNFIICLGKVSKHSSYSN